MKKVSVLVPVYNVEKYLCQCLDSILSQAFDDFEVVCVDDGSTDTSGTILDEYAQKDKRIRVIHKCNTGYGNTMNIALDNADGECVCIVESDDFIEPTMLSTLDTKIKGVGADVVKANYFRHSNGVDIYSGRFRNFPQSEVFNVYTNPSLLNVADTIWSCMYRKDFLDKNNIRFNETPGASFQDISFALQCWLLANKVVFIDNALLHYRIDNPGSSMHNPNKIFCVFDEYEFVENKLGFILEKNANIAGFFAASKYRDFLNHFNRVDMRFQYALLIKIVESLKIDTSRNRLYMEAFDKEIWQAISEIKENPNAYFQKKSKDNADSRLELCNFANDDIYRGALFKRLNNEGHLIIYGAGKIGKALAAELAKRKINVEYFAITGEVEEDGFCDGIPIKNIEEFKNKAYDYSIIIGVTERNQYELYDNIKSYGFVNIYRVDSILKSCL